MFGLTFVRVKNDSRYMHKINLDMSCHKIPSKYIFGVDFTSKYIFGMTIEIL